MPGKQRQRLAGLRNAGGGVRGQMQSPCQERLQPGGIGIESDGRAEQIDGLAETPAAERKQNAHARRPWIVRQMGGT